jgi:hypothetical protein
MRFLSLILLASLNLQIQYLVAEVTQINDDYVAMTTENLRVFVQDSEELRILKEGKNTSVKRTQFYIGGNMGTYGAGLNAGIIF